MKVPFTERPFREGGSDEILQYREEKGERTMAVTKQCLIRDLMEETGIRPKQLEMKQAGESEYPELVNFFIENGLEYDMEDEVETDLVSAYKIAEDGKLIAAACLAKREGCFIIDGIAVDPASRKKNVGTILLKKMIELTKEAGGEALYLVARAPGFFRAYGFETIDPAEAPNFFECQYCSQYNVSCHPEVMKYTIR